MDKKVERIINLYSRLMAGEVINKKREAYRFGVNDRTILRDINDIRAYFSNDGVVGRQLVYDRRQLGYRLDCSVEDRVTGKEILAVSKVLLKSRALAKDELLPIVDKLMRCCQSAEEQKRAISLIANERFYYKDADKNGPILHVLWDIAGAVHEHRLVRICYQQSESSEVVTTIIQPAGIVFSEADFFVTTYAWEQTEIAVTLMGVDEDKPREMNKKRDKLVLSTMYCVNQILEYEVLKEHFRVPYRKRYVKEDS